MPAGTENYSIDDLFPAPVMVAAPTRTLYRLGYAPNPLAWPPHSVRGRGRFDDPRRRFGVLYCSEQRRACFIEALAALRPELPVLSALPVGAQLLPVPRRSLPFGWRAVRRIGRFRLPPGQRWLDLRVVQTREALRQVFASSVLAIGLSDLEGATVRGPQRQLTQAIAGWAFDQGYHGLVYTSRFDDRWTCWAVFEAATTVPNGQPRPIRRGDTDLAWTAALFHLDI
ncbi:MAG TPA: RES family NAD+ phosphorylase [Chloroflexota bacterium]